MLILLLSAILGALIAPHHALAVVLMLYLGKKLRESESLLCCCTGYTTRKLVVWGRIIG